jgi:hypothetical protein
MGSLYAQALGALERRPESPRRIEGAIDMALKLPLPLVQLAENDRSRGVLDTL